MSETINVAEAYERGRTQFMGIELQVAPGALVPRPETELLGRTAVEALRRTHLPSPRIVDMCCGAGNLACAIALNIPDARVWASDLTDGCVELARRNAASQGAESRITVLQGDLFEALAGLQLEQTIDMIVCNPPYISEARLKGDRASLLTDEPREAFAAGPYGLSIHMRVTKDAPRYLRPGGLLLFEVGRGQDRQVATLLERNDAYENVSVVLDDAGAGRVVMAYAKG
ncbi:release factor glutamine methyltransferase [Bradyrhizobium japonicum]|uniref:N5-glutamine methyltransferase family protein n=1 Tax=Bradyrhizobium TaxID=374 RepID=UPI00048048CA|nr:MULTISPECIES: HemK/PrmC family methyltransferase [Bradyrhizobium]MBR0875943.1 peptide chain release factor N(5)-glutamine methyltransferase [Bradyrhizobium liaoningense]MBR0997028.1 peptide chain release factor N(5)-glutamine methyltransferase [Bradyrhizobium liaoningense]MBR1025392.1 peptide chain release factor N(5)-glutamine methyltransferase [Bradyrhizobium liaoningense]MBR1062429.1 peptide chain release factor N(5)-glutamine methyltransferase [Bradyrhizobium liaoningense]MCP1740000.1 r